MAHKLSERAQINVRDCVVALGTPEISPSREGKGTNYSTITHFGKFTQNSRRLRASGDSSAYLYLPNGQILLPEIMNGVWDTKSYSESCKKLCSSYFLSLLASKIM